MSRNDDVANWIRAQGRTGSYTNASIAKSLNLTLGQIHSARSKITRQEDDIRPVSPSAMEFHPGWKEEFPEEWEAWQLSGDPETRNEQPQKGKEVLPNVIGPMTILNNVDIVHVQPGKVIVIHTDGSETRFVGKLMRRQLCRRYSISPHSTSLPSSSRRPIPSCWNAATAGSIAGIR